MSDLGTGRLVRLGLVLSHIYVRSNLGYMIITFPSYVVAWMVMHTESRLRVLDKLWFRFMLSLFLLTDKMRYLFELLVSLICLIDYAFVVLIMKIARSS
ncbi:hypothetical protein RN38_16645 [Hafnia paralvei]|nr:hypothetical protein RN38_16645 [Hafnia paralvei]